MHGLRHVLWLAEIAPIILVGAESENSFSLSSKTQIGTDDRECAIFTQHRKQARRDDVDTGESQRVRWLETANYLGRIVADSPAAKLKLAVEQQMARGLAILHSQRGKGLMIIMKLHHAAQINRAENIDVVHEEGFFRMAGCIARTAEKEMSGLFQSPAGIEQRILARDFNVHAEIVIFLQVLHNHVGKVMNIDDYLANPKAAQA